MFFPSLQDYRLYPVRGKAADCNSFRVAGGAEPVYPEGVPFIDFNESPAGPEQIPYLTVRKPRLENAVLYPDTQPLKS